MKIPKKLRLIHPFLFAIYPVLLLFSQNVQYTSLSDILIPAGVIVGLTGLLLLLLGWRLNSFEKAGAITSISLVFFFFYGYIVNAIEIVMPSYLLHFYLLPVWGLMYVLAIYMVLRKQSNLRNLTSFLNIVIVVLVIASLINIGVATRNTGSSLIENRLGAIASESGEEKEGSRDIYYIVLERYGATSTLKELYDYDNEEFLSYLSEKGFYVASRSRANYLKTGHSLASSLNLEYINYLADEVENHDDWKPIYQMLEDYEVWRFLKAKGYDFVHLGGWWEPTRENQYADVSLDFVGLSEFSSVLISTTAIDPILSELNIGPSDRKALYYESELMRFKTLSRIPGNKGPTFTFAHMYMAHEPFVFDRNCEYLSAEEESSRCFRENYIDSLICTNKMVKKLTDEILSQYTSDNDPIIIIQGDEGPFPKRYREDELFFDWEKEATEVELKQKLRILNAYYLPGVEGTDLYPSITSVNTFRVVFNHYFGTD
ncbi:MAG: hypothetical protein ACLFVK_04315, partial [Dehalococcoidia bacterium]